MTSGLPTAPGEHNLVLILARGLASSIATPTFLVERDGTVVYFNEPAEALLGQTFAESGEMKLAEWGSTWPRSTGNPVSTSGPESFLEVAIGDRKPVHRALRIWASTA